MLRALLKPRAYSRHIRRSQGFTRCMSRLVHPTVPSSAPLETRYPLYDLDSSDIQLLTSSLPLQEENIRHPLPYGSDFLDVHVGELLPPGQDESDWGVQYIGCDEKLRKQVRIVRKLGYGDKASVWMGYEEPVGPNGRNYVAVKIFSLGATATLASSEDHNEVLINAVLDTPSQHPGASNIVKTHWHAIMKQSVHPNLNIRADRLMSVMDLCGPSMKMVQTYTRGDLPFAVWRKAFRAMLETLDYLHNERNMVHGDLKPTDILLSLSPSISLEELNELAEEPQQYHDFLDSDGKKVVGVPTVVFRKDLLARDPTDTGSLLRVLTDKEPKSIPLMERKLIAIHHTTHKMHEDDNGIITALEFGKEMDWKLCDFGSASPKPMDATKIPSHPPLFCNARRQAPELVLGLQWDEKIDIWALGCAMHEALVHGYIFNAPPNEIANLPTYEERGWYDLGDHLASMMAYSDTSIPLWMVQAFRTAERDKPEKAEREEIFDYSTGKLLKGKHISPLSPEFRASLQDMHPWLGQGTRSDELLYMVLARSKSVHMKLPPDVEPNEPPAAESLRDAVDMIKRCLTVDPRERPSAKELLEHPFFNDDDLNSDT